jgi:hypothetical protein
VPFVGTVQRSAGGADAVGADQCSPHGNHPRDYTRGLIGCFGGLRGDARRLSAAGGHGEAFMRGEAVADGDIGAK